MPVLPGYRPSAGYYARFQPEVLSDYGTMPYATASAGPIWAVTSSQSGQSPSPTDSAPHLPTSSAVVSAPHQAWSKEALLIIAIVLCGMVVFCLFFAILGRIIGLNQRWKDIDLHVRGVAVPQSARPSTAHDEQSGPYGEHGGSASTLFTTRRIIPTLPQNDRRVPIDGSSTSSSSHPAPQIGVQGDPERGYDEVNLCGGNGVRRVSGQSTTSSRVWKWIKSSFTVSIHEVKNVGIRPGVYLSIFLICSHIQTHAQHEEAPSLGPPRRADLQSFLGPTTPRNTPWSLPFLNAATALAPFEATIPNIMSSPRGYTVFAAERAALSRQAPLARRPQPEERVASWREQVPDFVVDSARNTQHKKSQRHRRQPSTLHHESSSGHLASGGGEAKTTDIGRQTSYSYRATSMADIPGPSQRSRRLTSAHLFEPERQGVRQRNISQQRKSRGAPEVIVSSAEPSEPSVYSKDSVPPTELSEEEQTRQILQRLERGFSTKSEAEDVIAFEPDSPTLTEGDGLLSPAVAKSGRTRLAKELLHNARERAARNGNKRSSDSEATSPRARAIPENPVDESLDMDASAPSFYKLSGVFLEALSPHLPDSGARLCYDACSPQRSSSPRLVNGLTTREGVSDEAKEAEVGPKSSETSQVLVIPTQGKGKDAEVPSNSLRAGNGDQDHKSLSPPQRIFSPHERGEMLSSDFDAFPDDADITPKGTPTATGGSATPNNRRQNLSELDSLGFEHSMRSASTPPPKSERVLLATPPTGARASAGSAASAVSGTPERLATLRPFAPLASLIPAGMSSPPAGSPRASSRTGGKRKVIR